MARKSKTQRAKASAARAARKAAREEAEKNQNAEVVETDEATEKPSRSLFKKKDEASEEKAQATKADAKKEESKSAKKKRFQFFRDVRSEMKRVTWPSRQDVLRWSGVVVVALLFFGIYVALFDNVIITPILVAVSGIGPALGL